MSRDRRLGQQCTRRQSHLSTGRMLEAWEAVSDDSRVLGRGLVRSSSQSRCCLCTFDTPSRWLL